MPGANILLVDADNWDDILRGCASACSMDINTELLWQEAEAGSADWLANGVANFMRLLPVVGQVIGGISYARHGAYFSQAGNEVVGFANAKYKADAQNFYNIFWGSLAREISKGPQAAVAYVNSRITLARSAMANVHYKFREAGKINDEVSRAWEVGIRRLDTMQVFINATFSVALSFLPGGILVLTAAGCAYTIGCNLITTVAGIPSANAVAYYKKQAGEAAGNAAVNAGQNALKFGMRNTLLERMAVETESILLQRAQQFAAQGGGEQFSRAQRRSLARAFAQHEAAAARAAQAGVRANYFAGSLGAAVGLLFMKDDIKRAFCNIAEEVAEARSGR